MYRISEDELRRLAEADADPCISIFLPTRKEGGSRAEPIRLKNLLGTAEEELVDRGLRDADARKILDPAAKLVDDTGFWLHQGHGLALYLAADDFRTVHLPFAVDELVVVSSRFHLKPLFPLLTDDTRFYILALSGKSVRLLVGTRYDVEEVRVDAVPESMADALKYDDPESQLQFHTGTSQGRPGKRPAMFHGHGVGIDDTKDNILRYCRQVDKGLRKQLKDEQVPLVLAAVDYLHSLFHEASSYDSLLPEGITGNPEGLSAEELHGPAWDVVEPHAARSKHEAAERYHELIGVGKASRDVKVTVVAAHRGRIDSVFVPLGIHYWGTFDAASEEITLHGEPETGDQDLLDIIAVQTFLHGGNIHAVVPEEVPGEGPVAAVFRY
jgi:hypothetical protein